MAPIADLRYLMEQHGYSSVGVPQMVRNIGKSLSRASLDCFEN
jgi:hypothetical protein